MSKDDPGGTPLDLTQVRLAARLLQSMRSELHQSWVGLDETIDWLLSGLIAGENVLLLGPPGVAKSELATRVFEMLGLQRSSGDSESVLAIADDKDVRLAKVWRERETRERATNKYFHYLLSRFTQPEELFGPIEINLLRLGTLARVNFGLLTGPGVRAAFLDEIFKASSSILNTLLTLTQERKYFNWGGMVSSEIVMVIGASNELPGGFGTGIAGLGSGSEDFLTLYAFLDRFPIRLQVPMASGQSVTDSRQSKLATATEKAVRREARKKRTGEAFEQTQNLPRIEDIDQLGRAILEGEEDQSEFLFESRRLQEFKAAFYGLAASLQHHDHATSITSGQIGWTISPRKLKAIYKIALAHAIVCDQAFPHGNGRFVSGPNGGDLQVFNLIWDTPAVRDRLDGMTMAVIDRYYRR